MYTKNIENKNIKKEYSHTLRQKPYTHTHIHTHNTHSHTPHMQTIHIPHFHAYANICIHIITYIYTLHTQKHEHTHLQFGEEFRPTKNKEKDILKTQHI